MNKLQVSKKSNYHCTIIEKHVLKYVLFKIYFYSFVSYLEQFPHCWIFRNEKILIEFKKKIQLIKSYH